MKTVRIFLVLMVLGALLAGLAGCSGNEETEEASTYTSAVQRGDLTLSISAAGNLALAKTEDVAIDLFYQQATVAEVLVEEGDSVTEGQELIKLDTDEWADELATLQKALITANRNLTTRETALYEAERQVKTRRSAVADAQRLVTTREFAVRQAELDVQSANYSLGQIDEVAQLQQVIDDAEFAVKFYQSCITGEFSGAITVNNLGQVSQLKSLAEANLAAAREDMNALLAKTGLSSTSSLSLQIAQKQLQIEQKMMALDDAVLAIEEARTAVEDAEYNVKQAEQAVKDAQLNVEDAQQSVEEVQANLDRAEGLSPVLTAPFDGFVTMVKVAGGDEVLKGTVAVQVADPDKFEADILVSETDILQVEVGTRATVIADAITGVSYPATVTHISPTATISSGVVNYTVRVELSALDDLASQFPLGGSENRTGGFPFGRPSSGNMSFEMPEGFEPPENFEMPEGFEFPSGGFGQMFGAANDSEYDLREGMSVTVNLITSSETNVLLVPYTAVSKSGGKSYVTVQLESGETEQREVTIGSTNYAMIAILDGLSEGETVVVPEGTITSSGSMQFPMGGGGFFMGGR